MTSRNILQYKGKLIGAGREGERKQHAANKRRMHYESRHPFQETEENFQRSPHIKESIPSVEQEKNLKAHSTME